MSAVIIMATAPILVSTWQALTVVNVPLDILSYLTNVIVLKEVILFLRSLTNYVCHRCDFIG